MFVLHFPLYKLSLFAREYTHTSPSWMYGAGYLILLYTTATVLDRYVDGRVRGMLKNRFFATTQKNIAGQHQAQPEPQTVDRLGQIGPDLGPQDIVTIGGSFPRAEINQRTAAPNAKTAAATSKRA